MPRRIGSFARDRRGVTMLEYAFVAVLVAVAAVAILATIGTTVSGMYSKVNSGFSQS